MSKKESNAVVEAQNTAVAMAMDFSADAGMGMEGADKTSFAIPFLTMLQGLSPQVESVEGAKPGKFINTITNELFDEVLVIPCAYQRRFIRWAPRASGGGYKGEYNPIEVETGKLEGVSLIDGTYFMGVPAGQPARDAKGQPLFDHLSDTRNHFCLAKTASGSWQPVLISMASTQIKESKRWMSRIQGLELRDGAGNRFNPPSFSHVYRLKPHKVENSKGSWWAFSAELIEQISDPEAYNKAKEFHKQVATGAVEVQQPVQQEAGSDEEKF